MSPPNFEIRRVSKAPRGSGGGGGHATFQGAGAGRPNPPPPIPPLPSVLGRPALPPLSLSHLRLELLASPLLPSAPSPGALELSECPPPVQGLRESLPGLADDAMAAELAVASGATEPCAALAGGGLPLCMGNRSACRFLMLLHGKVQQEVLESGEGSSECNMARSLRKAAGSLWDHPKLVRTRAEAEKLKGCGPAVGKLLERFFQVRPTQAPSEVEVGMAQASQEFQTQLKEIRQLASKKRGRSGGCSSQTRPDGPDARKPKKPKDYRPDVGSANYAFLVIMHQSACRGEEHITKHELMSRAESSGLANKSIYGERGGAGAGPGSRGGLSSGGFQGSARFSYNGWSSFKTLKNRDPPLVHSWSNPLKCRLTPEGSHLAGELHRDAHEREMCHCEWRPGWDHRGVTKDSSSQLPSNATATAQMENKPKEQELIELDSSDDEELQTAPASTGKIDTLESPPPRHLCTEADLVPEAERIASPTSSRDGFAIPRRDNQATDSESGANFEWVPEHGMFLGGSATKAPPLSKGGAFLDEYDVVLLVDTRERFHGRGNDSSLAHHIERIKGQGVLAETRGLSIGDALWVAREKRRPHTEYLLDTIVERKGAEDLVQSIKSKRWEKQLWILRRCGLHRRLYLVEGDLNRVNGGKIGLTAAVETEIFHGVRVFRTAGTSETIRMYGQLTKAIVSRYSSLTSTAGLPLLPTFEQLRIKVSDLKGSKVRDVFKLQLMQIPGFGKELSKIVLSKYPTVQHLLRAYEMVESQVSTEAEKIKKAEFMLSGIAGPSGRRITPAMSVKIYNIIHKGRP